MNKRDAGLQVVRSCLFFFLDSGACPERAYDERLSNHRRVSRQKKNIQFLNHLICEFISKTSLWYNLKFRGVPILYSLDLKLSNKKNGG